MIGQDSPPAAKEATGLPLRLGRRRRFWCRRPTRSPAALGVWIAQGGPPVARAQAAWTRGVREAWRSQLVGDAEDPAGVGTARRAARRADEFGLPCDRRERPQRRRDGLSVEPEDFFIGWCRSAGRLEKGLRLAAADPGNVIPVLLAPGDPDGALRHLEVERARRLDRRGRYRRVRKAPAPLGRSADNLGQLEPVASLVGPCLDLGIPAPLVLEHVDRCVRQIDRFDPRTGEPRSVAGSAGIAACARAEGRGRRRNSGMPRGPARARSRRVRGEPWTTRPSEPALGRPPAERPPGPLDFRRGDAAGTRSHSPLLVEPVRPDRAGAVYHRR